MPDIYVEIEHNIPEKELFKFHHLAKLWNKSLQETVEICMFEKRDEYIDLLENNVPVSDSEESNDKQTSNQDTPSKLTGGTEQQAHTN